MSRFEILFKKRIKIVQLQNYSISQNHYIPSSMLSFLFQFPPFKKQTHKKPPKDVIPQKCVLWYLSSVLLNPKNKEKQKNLFPGNFFLLIFHPQQVNRKKKKTWLKVCEISEIERSFLFFFVNKTKKSWAKLKENSLVDLKMILLSVKVFLFCFL